MASLCTVLVVVCVLGGAHSVGVARLGGLGMAGHVVIVCRGGRGYDLGEGA